MSPKRADHIWLPLCALKARTVPIVSMVKTLPSATTGPPPSRPLLLLPSPIEAVQATPSALPNATWPIDLRALPPDWAQLSFAAAAGSDIGMAAVAGSISISASLTSTATRSPSTGVLGFFLNRPPPAQPAIMLAETRRMVNLEN